MNQSSVQYQHRMNFTLPQGKYYSTIFSSIFFRESQTVGKAGSPANPCWEWRQLKRKWSIIFPKQYGLCLMRVTMSWLAFFNISISSKSRHNVPLWVIPIIINPYFFRVTSSFPVISLFTKTSATSSEMSSIFFAQQNTSSCVHSFTPGASHLFSVHIKLSNLLGQNWVFSDMQRREFCSHHHAAELSTTTSFVRKLVRQVMNLCSSLKLSSRWRSSDSACSRRHSCFMMIALLMSSENLLISVACGIL